MNRALVVGLYEVLVARDFSEARPGASIKILNHSPDGSSSEKIIVRPYAEAFLKDSREHFSEIILASCASSAYVESVMKVTGFDSLFDRVYSIEDLEDQEGLTSTWDEFGLVDHRDSQDSCVIDKLRFFQVPELGITGKETNGEEVEEDDVSRHLINIPPYRGNPDDCYLLDLLWAFDESEKLQEQQK